MMTTQAPRVQLAQRIESLRKRRGTSKKHLYLSAGMTQNTYAGRIDGRTDFTLMELISISETLGVNLADLIEAAEADQIAEAV